ncbi:hypothetical protein [Novilysobacter arseniciresistens]|uniref:hypothetical protein n=1 Tax=Novilysobacter arseniciresistens TaxID=1385522 RepID=UPI001269A8EC|nr:hypothetical protein [Lysobacter arseniciresistens]
MLILFALGGIVVVALGGYVILMGLGLVFFKDFEQRTWGKQLQIRAWGAFLALTGTAISTIGVSFCFAVLMAMVGAQ